ncbi:MAG: hypothetical protein FWD34_02905 [Oscillospiraceae bacterium]|nr:hypothetical protein [Oscillospiraceae bacterium]
MFWKKRQKKVAIVPVSVIFAHIKELMDINAPVLNLKIKYSDKIYRLGIASDFNRSTGEFFDTVFFIGDDCKRPWDNGWNCDTFDEFKQSAKLGDVLLKDINGEITVLEDEDAGCPSNITMFKPYIVEKENN